MLWQDAFGFKRKVPARVIGQRSTISESSSEQVEFKVMFAFDGSTEWQTSTQIESSLELSSLKVCRWSFVDA